MLNSRGEMTERDVREKSIAITEKLTGLTVYRQAVRILSYIDYNHEVITRYLIKRAWRDGKEVFAPKCVGKEMRFIRIKGFEDLKPGFKGIPEPVWDEMEVFKDKSSKRLLNSEDDGENDEAQGLLDDGTLMIMPGVAFDRSLHRIGYGGGYYDRFLTSHPDMRRIALAFDFQVLDEVPFGVKDISPEMIITEKRIYGTNVDDLEPGIK